MLPVLLSGLTFALLGGAVGMAWWLRDPVLADLPDVVSQGWVERRLSVEKAERPDLVADDVDDAGPPVGQTGIRLFITQLGWWPSFAHLVFVAGVLYWGVFWGSMAVLQELSVADASSLVSTFLLAFVLAVLGASWRLIRYQRKRLKRMNKIVSDALDMLTSCLEAGLSMPQSLFFVGQQLLAIEPYLARNFLLASHQFSHGVKRGVIFQGLKERTGLGAMKGLAAASIQMDMNALVTNMGGSLRAVAQQEREIRFAKAMEQAEKAKVKLNFTLIGFMLVPLFVLIITPAMMSVFEVLAGSDLSL